MQKMIETSKTKRTIPVSNLFSLLSSFLGNLQIQRDQFRIFGSEILGFVFSLALVSFICPIEYFKGKCGHGLPIQVSNEKRLTALERTIEDFVLGGLNENLRTICAEASSCDGLLYIAQAKKDFSR